MKFFKVDRTGRRKSILIEAASFQVESIVGQGIRFMDKEGKMLAYLKQVDVESIIDVSSLRTSNE